MSTTELFSHSHHLRRRVRFSWLLAPASFASMPKNPVDTGALGTRRRRTGTERRTVLKPIIKNPCSGQLLDPTTPSTLPRCDSSCTNPGFWRQSDKGYARVRAVNAFAPGPVWTPLYPADKSPKDLADFGADTPMMRPAQPEEIAPAYVFLASAHCASYITGEILPIIGGYSSR